MVRIVAAFFCVNMELARILGKTTIHLRNRVRRNRLVDICEPDLFPPFATGNSFHYRCLPAVAYFAEQGSWKPSVATEQIAVGNHERNDSGFQVPFGMASRAYENTSGWHGSHLHQTVESVFPNAFVCCFQFSRFALQLVSAVSFRNPCSIDTDFETSSLE